ncbi:RHS repeat domain-containing protein [Dinghuibacter silviterrae]|uniref:RHS repeat-associated protein n=1 Tax=Dinghuibacter silviterrae TaxID=1539049 RepID=A0A4R8DX15_9BACT|nr:RHS repeat-associated core domain-containing protein [Dinghuibacter silviterrae]TDX02075.1 RHS repeat-associated protein [Dinghuibacter silviterrae]
MKIKSFLLCIALMAFLATRAQVNFQFPGMQAQTAPITGGPQVGDTAVASDAEYIADYVNKTSLIDSAFIKNIVTFRLNEALPFVISKPFTAVLTYKVYFTGKDGKTYDSVGNTLTLTIHYDTARAATYPVSNSLVFYNGYQVKVKVIGITGADASVLPLLEVDNTVQYRNYYKFDCSNSAVTQLNITQPATAVGSIPDELPVHWAAVPGVTGYDLEWTYIDSSAYLSGRYGQPGTQTFYQNIFTNNATRVNLADTSTGYAIPLIFEKQGILFMRVRSVETLPSGPRMESDWKAYNTFGFSGHQTNLNWQSTTSFAEGGRKLSKVRYFDGSFRERQAVAKDNTTQTTIVSENFYDYQGRIQIKVMDAPTINTLIEYTPQFNNVNNGEYDKSHYDRPLSVYTCNAHADSMSSMQSGAAMYYSPNNPERANAYNQWIPDAQGYPFSETKYLDDNTGRLAAQGGLGPHHQLGSGHESLYYFGNPDQTELDGLFGTEAGYASHYLKNLIRDANGQYMITYIDIHGHTVATALAGNVPDSIKLDNLPNRKDSVLTKTMTDSTNNIVRDLTTESSKSLMLTQADNVVFNYTLPPSVLTLKNCNGQPVNYPCLYDLVITVTDDCKNQKTGGQPFVYSRQGISAATPVSFTVSLPEGSYMVTKRLSINQATLNYYADTLFLQNNLCRSLTSFVNAYIDSFKVTHPGCGNTDCGSCLAALGTYASFRASFIAQNGWTGMTITAAMESTIQTEYNRQVANCNLLCPKTANHIDEVTSDMQQDMTPPFGQYADSTKIDAWSIFRTVLIRVPPFRFRIAQFYQEDTIHYLDENGQLDHVYINGVATLPNNLTRAQFVDNFKPSWANALLKCHPEYARLQYLIRTVSRASYDWDNDFSGTTTFSAAYAKGYLNPTGNPGFVHLFSDMSFPINAHPPIVDSFFIRDKPQLSNMNANMQRYYFRPRVDTASIWGLASGTGFCNPNDKACALSNKYFPFSDTSSCKGSADMAWKSFMSLYETRKQQIIQSLILALYPMPGTLETDFQTGVHTSEFETNTSTIISDSLGINSTDTTQAGLAKSKAAIAAQISGSANSCAAYASVWWSQLASCTTAKLLPDSAAIINALVTVCQKGTDANHPNGASSIAPGTTNNFQSFDDVIAYYVHQYNQTHSDAISTVACNGELILYPQSYSAPSSQQNVLIYAKPDSCQCSRVTSLYSSYQALSSFYTSFSDYVQKNLGVSISEGTLDSLRSLCSGQISCVYLAHPISIPPALQCGYTSSCVNCAAFQKWVDSFHVAYPDINPSSDFTDSLQVQKNQLFTAYMNNKLGFSKTYDAYLAFIDTCGLMSPSPAQCASLQWTVYNPGTGLYVDADLYNAAIDNLQPAAQFFTGSAFQGPSSSVAGDYVLVDKVDNIPVQDSVVVMQWRIKPASPTDVVNPVIETGNNTYMGAVWAKDPADTTWLISQTTVRVSGGYVNGMGLQSNSHGLLASWVKVLDASTSAVLFSSYFPESAACAGAITNTTTTLCPDPTPPIPYMPPTAPSPCADSTNWATSRAMNVYNYYSDSVQGSFQNAYIGLCLRATQKESFTATQSIDEYQYTLYYYDQAGNLVKTVPPAGVARNYDPTWLKQVDLARANGQALTPAHTLITQYRYNTVNKMTTSQTPDEGTAAFWYDREQRGVLNQNAKQRVEGNNYSYNIYDALDRKIETGQINNASGAVAATVTQTPVSLQRWLANNTANRYMVTTTVYDQAGPSSIGPWLTQDPSTLRNRVSYKTMAPGQSGVQPLYTTYYSYDIDGNIKSVLQDYGTTGPMPASGQRYKRVDYQYDLICGRIDAVLYQVGKPDAYMQFNLYDAGNRVTDVFTSSDSVTIEHEANYSYYKHGQVARYLLGENQVQGVDVAFTLQGWLKGINSTSLNPAADMGADGAGTNQATRYVGQDAFGLSMNYFDGDYASITNTAVFNGWKQALGAAYKPLYNGNISSSALNIGAFNSARMYAYTYDQLNRITAMDVSTGSAPGTGTNLWDNGLTGTGEYKERVAYDANGNILRYFRNGYGNTLGMDSLVYAYTPGTNRLDHIHDSVPAGNYPNDIDNQVPLNYGYDAIGDLTSDRQSQINAITWTVYGKIATIQKTTGTISYQYDAALHRIGKSSLGTNTWYVTDAMGEVLAVYSGNGMARQEQYMYGRRRLGVIDNPAGGTGTSQYLGSKLGTGTVFSFIRGNKRFELSNQLGNVLVTVSDRKLAVPGPDGSTVAYYQPLVINAQDYYPFGSLMPGRNMALTGTGLYRYGFNGKENDNDVKGEGDQQDYGMRIYDPRVGRFLSGDPMAAQFPDLSPYQFASNRPIQGVDLDGLEFFWDAKRYGGAQPMYLFDHNFSLANEKFTWKVFQPQLGKDNIDDQEYIEKAFDVEEENELEDPPGAKAENNPSDPKSQWREWSEQREKVDGVGDGIGLAISIFKETNKLIKIWGHMDLFQKASGSLIAVAQAEVLVTNAIESKGFPSKFRNDPADNKLNRELLGNLANYLVTGEPPIDYPQDYQDLIKAWGNLLLKKQDAINKKNDSPGYDFSKEKTVFITVRQADGVTKQIALPNSPDPDLLDAYKKLEAISSGELHSKNNEVHVKATPQW